MFNHQLPGVGGWGEEPWFVAFADFYGVNTPTTSDFKIQCHQMQNWEEIGSNTIIEYSCHMDSIDSNSINSIDNSKM